ncbi:hypothetical protein JNL27_16995 [bacterium]|nr:hypothetical protein [bacterium]
MKPKITAWPASLTNYSFRTTGDQKGMKQGFFVALSADVFILKNLSIQVNVQKDFLPNITINEKEIIFRNNSTSTDYTWKALDPYQLKASSGIIFEVSARLHLFQFDH